MSEFKAVPFPPELSSRWQQILGLAANIDGWLERYTGAAPGADGELPSKAPTHVPLFDESKDDSGHDEPDGPYATTRHIGDTGLDAPSGIEYHEFRFGTFALFRVTNEQAATMSVAFDDTAPAGNERRIADNDHVIILYML